MRAALRGAGLFALAALPSLLLAAAAPSPPLKAMRWLAPGADAAAILTRRPPECLRLPADPDEAYRVELGRAAFRTPLILGGQPARAGIACESCHQNGRANRNFDFPGLSGAPGTADVTSSLFSSHRGDGVDNPRPIPDLGGRKGALRVSQARQGRALESFIHGLITEEFDGHEPPPAVLDGLAAYVRALNSAACPARASEPVRVEDAIADARRAVGAALAALARQDPAAAAVMVEAARSQLGAVDERFSVPGLATARQGLAIADLDLAGALAAIRQADPDAPQRLTLWLARTETWAAPLRHAAARSFYDARVLARFSPAPPSNAP